MHAVKSPSHRLCDLAARRMGVSSVKLSTRANSLRRSSEQGIVIRNMMERLCLSMKRFFSNPRTSTRAPVCGIYVCMQ
ncbi:hypothetical protein ACOMHN_067423 [Nucella lapillus]